MRDIEKGNSFEKRKSDHGDDLVAFAGRLTIPLGYLLAHESGKQHRLQGTRPRAEEGQAVVATVVESDKIAGALVNASCAHVYISTGIC